MEPVTVSENVRLLPAAMADEERAKHERDYEDRVYHFTDGRDGRCFCPVAKG